MRSKMFFFLRMQLRGFDNGDNIFVTRTEVKGKLVGKQHNALIKNSPLKLTNYAENKFQKQKQLLNPIEVKYLLNVFNTKNNSKKKK